MIETEIDVLRDISKRLTEAKLAFMLTGSLAMNYYAQPRMTRDIDVIVEISVAQTERFVNLFSSDYYVDPATVANAILNQSMFNIIHNATIIKVDCIVRKNEPYRIEEFSRRTLIDIDDFKTWIVRREDLILSKLVWAKTSNSEMQLRDVRNLIAPECDAGYLRTRATTLGINDLLSEVMTIDE